METESGQSLAHYRQHPGTGVTLYCRCGAWKRLELETVIGVLGEDFDITKVWRKAKEPCEACGIVQWLESRPGFAGGSWSEGP